MAQSLAVARYTILELSRRRLLLVIVTIGVVLMAGIGIAPHVLPGNLTDQDRVIALLTGLQGVVPTAMTLCAFAVGMTVINHDLDSGAVVSIFAKPISRASYTGGKLIAATGLLLLIAAIFTVGSLIVVAANGGSVYGVVFWTCAALAANIVLLMLLVMILTVYINNVVAAAIVLVFNYLAGQVITLHAMAQHNVITDAIAKALINVAYWGVPHELISNLQRQIMQMQLDTRELVVGPTCVSATCTGPLDRVPGASGTVDIVFWVGYLVALGLVLFWAVRRKQV
jgi:ABC-type transport system involved in multi-copper enzyme maturation permease subunit